MLVLGVNRILKWCQTISGGRRDTCPTKQVEGELLFKFKNEWHSVAKYAAEHIEELVEEGGKVIGKPFNN